MTNNNKYLVIADGLYVSKEYEGTNLGDAIEAFKRIDGNDFVNAFIYINGEKVQFK
jgi:hypothetical protein